MQDAGIRRIDSEDFPRIVELSPASRFGNLRVGRLESCLRRLLTGRPPNRRSSINCVVAVYNYGVERPKVDANPINGIKTPRWERRKQPIDPKNERTRAAVVQDRDFPRLVGVSATSVRGSGFGSAAVVLRRSLCEASFQDEVGRYAHATANRDSASPRSAPLCRVAHACAVADGRPGCSRHRDWSRNTPRTAGRCRQPTASSLHINQARSAGEVCDRRQEAGRNPRDRCGIPYLPSIGTEALALVFRPSVRAARSATLRPRRLSDSMAFLAHTTSKARRRAAAIRSDSRTDWDACRRHSVRIPSFGHPSALSSVTTLSCPSSLCGSLWRRHYHQYLAARSWMNSILRRSFLPAP